MQELQALWNSQLTPAPAPQSTPSPDAQPQDCGLLSHAVVPTETLVTNCHPPGSHATPVSAAPDRHNLPDTVRPGTTEGASAPFQCPHCPKYYPLLSTLRWHMKKVHKLHIPLVQFDRSKHSVDGMPICAMCGASFTRWEVLEAHITHQRCTGTIPTQTMEPQVHQASTQTPPPASMPKGRLQKTSLEPEPEQPPPPTAHATCDITVERMLQPQHLRSSSSCPIPPKLCPPRQVNALPRRNRHR